MQVNFEPTEWIIFAVMVSTMVIITFYFAWKKSNQPSETNQMGLFPISMTIVATNISSAAFRGVTELYQYGFYFAFEFVPIAIGGLVALLQIPVLYKLKLDSVNEYIEMRFDGRVKAFVATLLFYSYIITSAALCLAFALFLGQITNVGDMATVSLVISATLFLAVIGGFKGIIWTDTVQALATLGSLVAMLFIATGEVGGAREVFDKIKRSDRVDVDWSLDPTKRSTVWAMALGYLPAWVGGTSLASPLMYQRYTALSSETKCRWATFLSCSLTILIKFMIILFGVLVTVHYQGCDPVTSGQVGSYDQIFAYFVQEIGGRSKIVRSIYIIGYVCAGLSTLSTVLNTTAVIFYVDFFKKWIYPKSKPKNSKWIIIFLEILIGLSWFLIVRLFKKVGNVNDLVLISSPCNSIYFAIFTIGLFMPFVNETGTLCGGIVGFLTSCWILLQSSAAITNGQIVYSSKEMRVDECGFNVTQAKWETNETTFEGVFFLYRISNYYNGLLTFLLVICVASVVSLGTRSRNQRVDRELLSPLVRRFVPRYEYVATTIPGTELK